MEGVHLLEIILVLPCSGGPSSVVVMAVVMVVMVRHVDQG
jgi:hypothetical protein